MGKEPLLQKVRIQEDIESDKKTRVNGGDDDGPVTFVLLLTTVTALWGTFSYGTAVSFHIFTFHAFSLVFARVINRVLANRIDKEQKLLTYVSYIIVCYIIIT